MWEVAHPSDETFRRECASDTVVWLVWEVAHPSDETFRRAWGACANVCAPGVERACELSRRATMEWSELSRSACANVRAQGGVAWSELRRCRADEAYRPAASDTRLARVGGLPVTRLLGASAPQTVVWLVWEVATQGRDFSARVRLRQVVWLVWEVAHPVTRLFGASAPQTQ